MSARERTVESQWWMSEREGELRNVKVENSYEDEDVQGKMKEVYVGFMLWIVVAFVPWMELYFSSQPEQIAIYFPGYQISSIQAGLATGHQTSWKRWVYRHVGHAYDTRNQSIPYVVVYQM